MTPVFLIVIIAVFAVYFDFSRITKKSSPKERCRSIFNPNGIIRMLILYLVLLLLQGYRNLAPRMISFMISFVFTTFVVFGSTLLFLDRLRDRYDSKTVYSLWLLPNVLYFVYYWVSATPAFRPLFVFTIDHDNLIIIVLLIWLFISGVLFLKSIISHIRFRRKLEENLYALNDEHILELWNRRQDAYEIKERKRIPLFTSPSLSSPVTVGVRNIILVLPEKKYSDEDLELIFNHELVHIIREDGVTKFYLSLCRAFNFFNPFIYIGTKKCSQDIELACDEIVLLDTDEEKRIKYGDLILSSIQETQGFTSCLSADAQSLKYRLTNVIHPKEKKNGKILLSVCTLLVLLIPSLLFGTAYNRQRAGDLFFNGNIDYENMTIRKERLNEYDIYQNPDKERMIDYLNDLEAYEIYASEIFDGNYIDIVFTKNDISYMFSFNQHYIVFRRGNETKVYYVRNSIDMEYIEELCKS